jgi:hypothetical protein
LFDIELKHGRKDGVRFGLRLKGQPYLMKGQGYTVFCHDWGYNTQKKGMKKVYKLKKYKRNHCKYNLGLLEVDLVLSPYGQDFQLWVVYTAGTHRK